MLCSGYVNQLDLQIDTHHLHDHFEWDLGSTLTPEAFARTLCTDIGLSGEAIPLISHAIHEELLKHKKDAADASVIGPGAVGGAGTGRGAKRLRGVWRDWTEMSEYGPRLELLTAEELERRAGERERAIRYVTFSFLA